MDKDEANKTAPGIESDEFTLDKMSYNDYTSCVLSIDSSSQAVVENLAKAEKAKKQLNSAKEELAELISEDEDNRRTYDGILNGEVRRRKEVWQKNQARYDVKLTTMRAVAEQNAKNDIESKREEHRSNLEVAQKQKVSLEKHLKELETDYAVLTKEQKKLTNFTGKSFPPVSENALEFLESAYHKNLLSPKQRDLLTDDVDTTCKEKVESFDGLVSMEKKLVRSEFFRKVRAGKVTPELLKSVGNAAAISLSAFLAVLSVILFIFPPSGFSALCATAFSTVGFGGLLAVVLHFARPKLPKDMIIPYKALSEFVFSIGVVVGFVLGAKLTATSRHIAALVYTVAMCVSCGIVFRRILLADLPSKLLSKTQFLRNKQRKRIFREYENEENGLYNFMIYCYLRHEPILMYLSMLFKQNEINMLQEKMNFNRKDLKYYTAQLEDAKKRINDLQYSSGDVFDYEKERNAQLARELLEIEAKRPPEPDFRADAAAARSEDIAPLEKEHRELTEKIRIQKDAVARINDEYRADRQNYLDAKAFKKRVIEAITYWTQSPRAHSIHYGMVDILCLMSGTGPTLIEHKCDPFVIRYSPKERHKNPSESVIPLIFQFIRGYCIANSWEITQVNIFDYVSNPRILLESGDISTLDPKRGVINGIYSKNDFEIRLFSDRQGFSTFGDFFSRQGQRAKNIYDKYKDTLAKGEELNFKFANKIINNPHNLLMYQLCIFVVPRKGEDSLYRPPRGIFSMIEKNNHKKYGLLPIFLVDEESIADSWVPYLENFNHSNQIYSLN